jgi:hypothetical protein
MGLKHNRRGISGEVMKIGLALLLALLVFALFTSFSARVDESDSDVEDIGKDILNFTQDTTFQIKDNANNTE